MNDERRYSEAELHAIFERAAERQEEARHAEAASRGQLTLAELQQIGADSGIDPAHVAAAAAELNRPSPPAKRMLGFPAEVRRTRFIPGPVTDEAWEQMVAELRRTFDQPGVAGEVGRVREWTTQVHRRRGAAVRVSLDPVEGGTRVTIEQTLRSSALPFVIMSAAYAGMTLFLGTLLATGVFEPGEGFVVVLFAALAVLMFGGSRIGFGLYAKRQNERFDHALDRLDLIARDANPRDAQPEPARTADAGETTKAPPEAEGRIDLDSLPDESGSARPAGRNRTRS